MHGIENIINNNIIDCDIMYDELMSKHTSFGIGGRTNCIVFPKSISQVKYLLRILNERNIKYFIIGSGTNMLVSDYGYNGVIISLKKNIVKGSARSVIGFDIGSQIILAVQLGILQKGGGHKMAGGFTLKKENIPRFRDFLIKNFNKTNINSFKNINLYLDSIIAPSALNEKFLEEINCLAPFGSGNSEPKFVIENIKVISSNIVGNFHIKSILSGKDGFVFKAFVWNGKNSPLEPFLKKKNKKLINIAGKMRLNEWRGKRNVEFMIEDISLN